MTEQSIPHQNAKTQTLNFMKHPRFTRKLKSFFTIAVLFLITSSASAQNKTELLTNQSVMALSKAGLDKSLIITTINNTESKFDVSATTLIALKKQGLSNEIISAMVEKSANKKTIVTSQQTTSHAAAALSSLEPGIYYAESATKQVQLEPSVFTSSKTGSGIGAALSYGIAKVKSKAVLSGPTANLKFPQSAANSFYFIFPKNGGGNIGNEGNQNLWISSATSPNEFVLIKFKSINTSKQKAREVVTGSYGTYSGFSNGIPDDNKVAFRSEKLSSGLYRIYFESPLAPGEYAFLHAGGSASSAGGAPAQKAFDFSITN